MAPSAASASARLTAVVLLPTPPLPEATATMFFTLGSSCTPRCTACATILRSDVDADVARRPARVRAAAISALRSSGNLALGGVAQLDVEGHVAAVDAQVLQLLGGDEVLAGVRVDTVLQRVEQGGFGEAMACHGVGWRGTEARGSLAAGPCALERRSGARPRIRPFALPEATHAMTRKLFVTTALPYANAPFHIGHMMEYIQADIWVRFQRMQGHEVHFVCADDAHGAPIMIAAEKAGLTPQAVRRPRSPPAASSTSTASTSASTTGTRPTAPENHAAGPGHLPRAARATG